MPTASCRYGSICCDKPHYSVCLCGHITFFPSPRVPSFFYSVCVYGRYACVYDDICEKDYTHMRCYVSGDQKTASSFLLPFFFLFWFNSSYQVCTCAFYSLSYLPYPCDFPSAPKFFLTYETLRVTIRGFWST